ncbi:acyltransferase [Lentilitoribacter sp. EG35]|uniref:acyltransferase n=1 Tax=Lentilitoribacter sp. EG35 TaxID=3234192 RepID=UPI00345F8E3F
MRSIYLKVLSKLNLLLTSTVFRIKHKIPFGKFNIDQASLKKCDINGSAANLRGFIRASDSTIIFDGTSSVAKTAEIGASNTGKILICENVAVGPRCVISTTGGNIKIGNRSTFFSDCLVSGRVDIGHDCLFANNVTVLSGTHHIYGNGTIRENDAKEQSKSDYNPFQPVQIGSDCWLGANSVVLPGITIAKGTVVGANTVVTKDFPEYSILGGVPAKLIGSRIL